MADSAGSGRRLGIWESSILKRPGPRWRGWCGAGCERFYGHGGKRAGLQKIRMCCGSVVVSIPRAGNDERTSWQAPEKPAAAEWSLDRPERKVRYEYAHVGVISSLGPFFLWCQSFGPAVVRCVEVANRKRGAANVETKLECSVVIQVPIRSAQLVKRDCATPRWRGPCRSEGFARSVGTS